MTKKDIITIINMYKSEYEKILFTAADEAPRTDDNDTKAAINKIYDDTTQKYEAVIAILNTIEAAEATEENASEHWKAGRITKAEKEYLINDAIYKEVVKEEKTINELKEDITIDLNTNVQTWYHKKYHTDDMYKDIDPAITFNDIVAGFKNRIEFYSILGVGDSIIRGRIFNALVEALNNDINANIYTYDDIYIAWLHNEPITAKEAHTC